MPGAVAGPLAETRQYLIPTGLDADLDVATANCVRAALGLLQANPKSEKGFFLQVEGASIDKQDHNANACGQIGETDDLDKAISAALKKVDLSDTLIIVTADHAHTSQIVESQPYYALSTVLKNADGSKTTISYGTSEKNLDRKSVV